MSDQPKRPTKRLTSADFKPEVLRLFDQYVHGQLDRRGFLDRAARHAAGGAAGAAGLLAALSPNFVQAQQIAPDDARIKTGFVEFASPDGYGKVRAYVARPANAKGPLPVVLVAHENRGLNPHIEDIARRLAVSDFIAIAPDALFPLGGYPGDEDKARELFGKLDQAKTREDFVAAAGYARGIEGGNGRLGSVGFCYGGGIVNMLATRVQAMKAGAAFYGAPPALDKVANISNGTELLLIFAAEDERINAMWPAYKDTLEVAGVHFEAVTYAGVQHGFNNDTTPRYDQAAAGQAWGRTMALFGWTLRA